MRNSLISPLAADLQHQRPGHRGNRWRVLLPALILLPAFLAVVIRVFWIQTTLPQAYLAALQVTTTELEALPAADGRIMADGVVLAADELVQNVQLHYRWLQEDPDEDWLSRQVRGRLSRTERREETLVHEVEAEIRQQREQMLQTLAKVSLTSRADLQARCDGVQDRVERIIRSVNLRRGIRVSAGGAELVESEESWQPRNQGWLMRLAGQVREALTTPPQRRRVERVIVREEESWHTVLEDVDLQTAALIAEHPEQFPGVRVQQTSRRTYPHPNLAVHAVGARTQWRPPEDGGDIPIDHPRGQGRFGLEKYYNDQLSGIPGLRRIVRDRRQRIISEETVRQPLAGIDLHITLDPGLQQHAEQLLEEVLGDAEQRLLAGPESEPDTAADAAVDIPSGGSIVVMDVHDGRLLALASGPEFDLRMFTEGTEEQWRNVNNDSRRPFVSRFLAMSIPPGSTWKPVTALAALESGAFSATEEFFCQGYLNRPDELRCLLFRRYGVGHGNLTLTQAMAQSCNVYFFTAVERMGERPLIEMGLRLGFGDHTGVDLPFERTGNIPGTRRVQEPASGEHVVLPVDGDSVLSAGDRAGLAIGQSRLTVTPLQMARGLAAIANGGTLVVPHLVSGEEQSQSLQGGGVMRSPRTATAVQLKTKSLVALQRSLEAVVQSASGTANRTVQLPGVRIAGKTGTAETGAGSADHAWFTGYFPAENPQYVVVVALEHGGSGGRTAGPVAREVIRYLLQRDSDESAGPAYSSLPPLPAEQASALLQ